MPFTSPYCLLPGEKGEQGPAAPVAPSEKGDRSGNDAIVRRNGIHRLQRSAVGLERLREVPAPTARLAGPVRQSSRHDKQQC